MIFITLFLFDLPPLSDLDRFPSKIIIKEQYYRVCNHLKWLRKVRPYWTERKEEIDIWINQTLKIQEYWCWLYTIYTCDSPREEKMQQEFLLELKKLLTSEQYKFGWVASCAFPKNRINFKCQQY